MFQKSAVLFGLLAFAATGFASKPPVYPFRDAKEVDIKGPHDVRIHVYETVPANPKREIIWVHGMPGAPRGRGMAPTFLFDKPAALADSIITFYDRPGFGQSGFSFSMMSLGFETEVLGALLKRHPGVKHYIGGWSAGGKPTISAAVTWPNEVQGIMLISAAVNPLGRDLVRQLPRLNVPVIMLHGDADDIVDIDAMDYFKGQMEKIGKGDLVETHTLRGVDHHVVQAHPADVGKYLQALIDKAEK